MEQRALQYLQERAREADEAQGDYGELIQYHESKMWFQLSSKLLALTRSPRFLRAPRLLDLFRQYARAVEARLKPLHLAQLAVAAAQQEASPAARVEFLRPLAESLRASSPEALVLVQLAAVQARLEEEPADAVRPALEEARRGVDSYPGVMAALVQSRLFRAEMDLARKAGDDGALYAAAVMFLAHTPLSDLEPDEQVRLASEVGAAALVARRVYNFGELLQHPVVQSLRGTQHEYLLDLLRAFNAGDIDAHDRIMRGAALAPGADPRLAAAAEFLAHKVRLMALVDLLFRRASDDRVVAFADVARAARLPESGVEVLLIRALSSGVVRGTIDEIDRTFAASWVQPRVLDLAQVGDMAVRLKAWSERVAGATALLEHHSKEILGAGN